MIDERRGAGGKTFLFIVAIAALLLSIFQLWRIERRLTHTRTMVGNVPVEIIAPQEANAAQPALILAHGFSACKQYMYPLAYSVAQNGYVAAVFDFSGHGSNPTPFPYDWRGVHYAASPLGQDLTQVLNFVRAQPQVQADQIALLGYSMGSGIATRYGRDNPAIDAVISVSGVFSDVMPAKPRNLLLLTGAFEMANLKATAEDALNNHVGDEVQAPLPDQLYGDLAAGTATKLVYLPFSEHASAPWNPRAWREVIAWLDGTFGRSSDGLLDTRLIWVGLFMLSALILLFPLSRLLLSGMFPPLSSLEVTSPLEITGLLLVAGLPAILTPLLLRFIPYRILPLATGDYVAAFFLLYGLLTTILLLAIGSLHGEQMTWLLQPRAWLGGLLIALYLAATVGLMGHLTLINLLPIPRRISLIVAAFFMVAPYFFSSEYISRTRYPGANQLFPILTKIILLAALLAGAYLGGPSVLLLFLPVVALLVMGLGIINRWLYNVTSHPGVSAVLSALVFAWLIGTILPII